MALAVVLLTPDDVGCAAKEKDDAGRMKARARQNVITELGYFIGKLGRDRVCALYKDGVELPSDYHGILYIPLDPAGAWKPKLAQELVGSKISIDVEGLLGA